MTQKCPVDKTAQFFLQKSKNSIISETVIPKKTIKMMLSLCSVFHSKVELGPYSTYQASKITRSYGEYDEQLP